MIKFGTDGLRGRFNEDLRLEHALKLGEYLALEFGNKPILIAEDSRISSPLLAQQLSLGIASKGGEAHNLGLIPTPGLSYILEQGNYGAGVMVSASHNPYYDNGLKVFLSTGKKLSEKQENEIESYLSGDKTFLKDELMAIGKIKDVSNLSRKYLEHLNRDVHTDLSGLKIVLDSANGATSNISQEIFESMGATVVQIANHPNGLNINHKCGSTYMNFVKQKVLEEKADFGFAFDGDGDRCLAVDHTGKIIDGDLLIYIVAKDLMASNNLKNNGIAVTIMANLGFVRSCQDLGITVFQTDVGDKHVAECLHANDLSLGGEQSGHIIFSDLVSTGDGLLTALKISEIVVRKNKTLHELANECDIYPQVLEKVYVDDKNELMEDKNLLSKYEEINESLSGQGRILVRASGTEEVIRVMVEAPDKTQCEKYCAEMIQVINQL